MDYNNARKTIRTLAEGAERRENERNERDIDAEYRDDDLKAKGREASDRRDREEAADLKAAVEVFGDLTVDIAESLNKIASRGTVRSGHPDLPGHIQ